MSEPVSHYGVIREALRRDYADDDAPLVALEAAEADARQKEAVVKAARGVDQLQDLSEPEWHDSRNAEQLEAFTRLHDALTALAGRA